MKKRIILSSSIKNKELSKSFIKDLESKYELIEPESINDKTLFTHEITVLILGGDGSINYFINIFPELKKYANCNVVYFPMGTANDFAKSINITPALPSLQKFESILNYNKKVSIPLGLCNKKRFINAASIGIAAQVTSSEDGFLKKITGKLSYYISALEKIISPVNQEYKLELDQNVEKLKTCGFVISQGLYAGGGARVTTSFTPNFGKDFNIIYPNSDLSSEIIQSFIKLQTFDYQAPAVFDFSNRFASQMEISSEVDIPVKLDGEDYKSKRLLFKKSGFIKFYIY